MSASVDDFAALDRLNSFDEKLELAEAKRLQRIAGFLSGRLPDSGNFENGYAHLAGYQQYGSFGPHAAQRVDGRSRLMIAASENLGQCLSYGPVTAQRPFRLVAQISPRPGVDPVLRFAGLVGPRCDEHEVGLVMAPDPGQVTWHLQLADGFFRIVDAAALHAALAERAPGTPLPITDWIRRGILVAEPALDAVADLGTLFAELFRVMNHSLDRRGLRESAAFLCHRVKELRARYGGCWAEPRVKAALRVGREKIDAALGSPELRRRFGDATGARAVLAPLKRALG